MPIGIHQTFAQFESKVGSIDLDLMLVNDETFQKMAAQSKVTHFDEMAAHIPSLEHLIALKLHALKQELRHRHILDFDDVMNLVLKNGINVEESHWRDIFEKHGTLDLYERIRKATRA